MRERYSGNNLREASESMVGKVERIPLMVNDIYLERIFTDYRDKCEDIFERRYHGYATDFTLHE
ncbi:6600_t:CDS:2 [Paraglomus occultum]|uniref:6600_t:CDS:1 n=1 Tax=Paraglomus occultum TaxID=144539 RepID=A0A9N9BTN0_9GLOM|nr:6600_t:CDS:2 [Paraglomus occultum]